MVKELVLYIIHLFIAKDPRIQYQSVTFPPRIPAFSPKTLESYAAKVHLEHIYESVILRFIY